MAKLESQIPTQGTWQKRGQRLEPTVFDIVLPLENFVFQQASVNAMVTDENMSLAWYDIQLPQMLLIYLLTISTTAKAALSHHNCLHCHLGRERNTTDYYSLYRTSRTTNQKLKTFAVAPGMRGKKATYSTLSS